MMIQSVTHAISGVATAASRAVMDDWIPVPNASPKFVAMFVKGVWSMCYRCRFADAIRAALHHDRRRHVARTHRKSHGDHPRVMPVIGWIGLWIWSCRAWRKLSADRRHASALVAFRQSAELS